MRCADFIVKEPMVIGHECAGVIEEVGSGVKSLVPGDRVALEPGISCWRCGPCKEGRYNLCPEMKFFATPPVHGSLANQVNKVFSICKSDILYLRFLSHETRANSRATQARMANRPFLVFA